MNNAFIFAKRHNRRPGMAMNAAQIAQLSKKFRGRLKILSINAAPWSTY